MEVICPECDGHGQLFYEVMRYGGPPGAYSPFDEVLMDCELCEGSGEIADEEKFDE